jgi:hypothetical protein
VRRASAAVVVALAFAGCGSPDEDQSGGDPTREQVAAAMRQSQPNCASPRAEDLHGEVDVETFLIACGPQSVLWHRTNDAAAAQHLAQSGGITDYIAGRVVIVPMYLKDREGFIKALAEVCGCEITRD